MSLLTDPPVDPRGPRFAAWVTTTALIAVLVTGSAVLLAAQAIVFALGAFAGLRFSPYGLLYRAAVAPLLAPPTGREDAAPVRFAQGVGFAFAAIGTLGYALGAPVVGNVATAMALGAAFLNAAFGYCLGCEIYLRLPARLRGRNVPDVNELPDVNERSAPSTVSTKGTNATNTQRGVAA